MTVILHDSAGDTLCPISRTFAEPVKVCRGDACPLWRWIPLLATEPAFKAAISKAISDGLNKHPAAVRHVMENRADYGLPTEPYRGFCGLGGRPTDVQWVEK